MPGAPNDRPPRSRGDVAWTALVVALWAIFAAGVIWLIAVTFAD